MAESATAEVGGDRCRVDFRISCIVCSMAYVGSLSIGGMLGFSKLLTSLSTEGATMVGGELNNQQPKIIKERDIVDYFMGIHITNTD